MEETEKEVYFDYYCKQCKHFKKEEWEEPCDTCLCNPSNTNSHKPVYFEEKEKKQ